MEGDTILATFEREVEDSTAVTAAPDSASDPLRLRSLAASGKARSLYRMAPNDSARAGGEKRPAIHYVTATAISLEMNGGEVSRMDVQGETDGVHAEPAKGPAPAAAASTRPSTAPASPTPSPAAPGVQTTSPPPAGR